MEDYNSTTSALSSSSFFGYSIVRTNTEALEQYKQVAASRVGRLEPTSDGWAKLILINSPENIEAVNMALELVSGSEPSVTPDENIIIALSPDFSQVRKNHRHKQNLGQLN